eukprot:4039209-Alexandrium_andersonii.AAC.1
MRRWRRPARDPPQAFLVLNVWPSMPRPRAGPPQGSNMPDKTPHYPGCSDPLRQGPTQGAAPPA